MARLVTGAPLPVEWGVAARSLPGQTTSGDRHVVQSFSNGILIAVVDGLGHGDEAAEAARIAATTLETFASEAIISLVKRCHEALRRTRGAVLSLASFDIQNSMMHWLGVGNVEGVLVRADLQAKPAHEAVLLRGGVVGGTLPALREARLPVSQGDILIFATDGIRSGFLEGLVLIGSPQTIAGQILCQNSRGTDDALVLVARYLGGALE